MGNEYEQAADLSSVETDLSIVENYLQQVVGLNSSVKFGKRVEVNSSTWTTVYENTGSGLLSVKAIVEALTSGNVYIEIYQNNVQNINKIGGAILGAYSSACGGCGYIPYTDGVIVRAIGDGSNPFEVIISDLNNKAVVSNTATLIDVFNTLDESLPNEVQQNYNLLEIGIRNGGEHKLLIQLDVSAIPSSANIISATYSLGLYQGAGLPASYQENVHNMLVSFVNAEATWNERSTGVAWDSPGLTAGVDYETEPFATRAGPLSRPETLDLDFTQWLQAVVDGSINNNGVLIQRENVIVSSTSILYVSQYGAYDEPVPILSYESQ